MCDAARIEGCATVCVVIHATTSDELPAHVPTTVRQAAAVTLGAERHSHNTIPWLYFPGLVLRFKQIYGDPKLAVSYNLLEPEETMLTIDVVRKMLRGKQPKPTPGAYVGCALMVEGNTLADGVEMPDVTGEALNEWFADKAATGDARQFRMAVALFESGWRFKITRERHGDGVEIDVYEPGDEWVENDLTESVAEVHARLSHAR